MFELTVAKATGFLTRTPRVTLTSNGEKPVAYVLDQEGQSVVRALENPKWDWRTIDGIAEETGIPPDRVASILRFLPSTVDLLQSAVPDKRGRSLFTTRSHYLKRQSIGNRILSAFSDRIR